MLLIAYHDVLDHHDVLGQCARLVAENDLHLAQILVDRACVHLKSVLVLIKLVVRVHEVRLK